MDLSGMASHLQSSDLSALNNADIRNEAFQEFFRGINEKMSWEITKNQFDIQNGTAQITVHVKYVDGSNIYRDAINEFLRQIVSAALSGQDISDTKAKMQENLASILTEKAKTAEPEFSETDITYPLIRENKIWKIVALDEETVKIMSANFKNATEEIQKTLIEDNTSATDDLSEAEDSEGEGSADTEDSEGKVSSAEAKSETAAENPNDKTTSADSDATNSEDKIVSSDSDAKDSTDKTASENSDVKTTSANSNSKNPDGKTVSADSDAKDSEGETAPAASGKDLNLAGANFSFATPITGSQRISPASPA